MISSSNRTARLDLFVAYFIVACCAVLLLLIPLLLWQSSRAGALLVDLGPDVTLRLRQLLLVGFGGVLALASLIGILVASGDRAIFALTFVSNALLAIGQLWSAFQPRQVRLNGFYRDGGLVRWEAVEAFEWIGEDELTLSVRVRRRLPLPSTMAWPMRLEEKRLVQHALRLLIPEKAPFA